MLTSLYFVFALNFFFPLRETIIYHQLNDCCQLDSKCTMQDVKNYIYMHHLTIKSKEQHN